MWYVASDINQSQQGWQLRLKHISLGEFEFTSRKDTVSAHKFIIAVYTHKPWCGHCESSANQRCHLSEGAGEESDEGGGENTQRMRTKMKMPREMHTHIQRRK